MLVKRLDQKTEAQNHYHTYELRKVCHHASVEQLKSVDLHNQASSLNKLDTRVNGDSNETHSTSDKLSPLQSSLNDEMGNELPEKDHANHDQMSSSSSPQSCGEEANSESNDKVFEPADQSPTSSASISPTTSTSPSSPSHSSENNCDNNSMSSSNEEKDETKIISESGSL